MRPGPHPWCTNAVWAAGPDVGSDAKIETTDALREEGYYRQQRPGPDTLNWQMNRGYLAHQFAAKMFAANYTATYPPTGAGLAGDFLLASAHHEGVAGLGLNVYFYIADTIGAGASTVITGQNGHNWSQAAGPNPGQAVNTMDADHDDDNDTRLIAFDTAGAGAGDFIYHKIGVGAWGASVFGAPPGFDWMTVGCDRNTAGGAAALWVIGNDPGVGPATPDLYTSTDPSVVGFVVNASFGALVGMAGEAVHSIGHTCHPAGALGPDDVGNPSWLALTDTFAITSADGVTWVNEGAHLLGATITTKGAAYSRTAGRWVAPVSGGAGAVRYSDDNGTSWTTFANTLPNCVGITFQIQCDGYGTFVIMDNGTQLWVSSDDGESWMETDIKRTLVGQEMLEVGFTPANNWNTPGDYPTYFCVGVAEPAAGPPPEFEAFRSLVY